MSFNLKNLLFYAGLTKEEYEKIIPDIRNDNRKNLKVYTAALIIILTVETAITIFAKTFASINTGVYFISDLLAILLFISLNTFARKETFPVQPFVYFFIAAVYSSSLSLLYFQRDKIAVTFVVLLLGIPLMFSDRPIRMLFLTIIADLLFCVFSHVWKSKELAYTDTWNGITFGAITIVIEIFILRIRIQNISQTRKIMELSELDILTGARNRNSYEQNLSVYEKDCSQNLCCIYADVNGLHQLNNMNGHKAGDRMLQVVADELKNQFDVKNTYRVGGDEFVCFVSDSSFDEIEQKIQNTAGNCAQKGYSVSFGIATAKKSGLNMEALVKKAEQKMYSAKSDYYRQSAVDRRLH